MFIQNELDMLEKISIKIALNRLKIALHDQTNSNDISSDTRALVHWRLELISMPRR